jgi:leader peptidase (prepilin peptidase)/N-methyltransferase
MGRYTEVANAFQGGCGELQYYFYAVALLLGLSLGSFLNVVIYRLPRRESLVRPGSHCPHCESAIRFYDNIPIVSWLLLRGRCRDCASAISARYPLVEATTGVAFVLALWRFGFDWPLLISWAFIAAMVAVAFIDYDHMIIPNRIVLPGAVLGLVASITLHPAGFLFILALVWPGGMGPGDIKLALFMGAVLGAYVMVALFAAFLFGSLVGIFMLLVQKRSRKEKIPFGPYLAMGAILAALVGETLLNSYLRVYN